MGDFNSHTPIWGYPNLDPKGDEVKDWIITNQMVLINRPDEPHTYYSRAWRKTSCPDIAITTDDVAKITKRHVEQQLGGSDHKPVLLVIKQDLREAGRKLCLTWNYKKANWPEFRKKADENCRNQMMEQHHLNGNGKLSTGALPKKQFPEERLHPRLKCTAAGTSQYCQQSERRWNLAQQMKTQLPTTKPKQNLPDRSSNRHMLLGMKERPPSTWKKIRASCGSSLSC